METNISKENKNNYNSILQNINHKPIIVEYIFSYIKNDPYKFLRLMEKDQTLKESINSQFFNVKKNNLFSKEMNDNIELIIFYKKYIEIFRSYKNKDYNIFQKNDYEENITKNNSDPSFILYKSQSISNLINKNESFKNIEGLIDIALNEQEKYEHIQLVYLPSNNNNYKDSLYIKKNLNNDIDLDKNHNCKNKEIDTLYCIIDDNEYYLDENLHINKNIIINEIYFIYIKGIKNINLNDAIEKYLNSLNKKNIKQFTYGYSFYKVDIDKKIPWYNREYEISKNAYKMPIRKIAMDALLGNKKYTFPKPISINLIMKQYSYIPNQLIISLGIYHLFPMQTIDGIIEINSKSYGPNSLEKIKNSNGNILIIKYNGLSSLDDNNFNKFVKKCLKVNIPNVIIYITKDVNDNNKKNNEIINFDLDENKNYLIYSEIPTKKIDSKEQFKIFKVLDSNNNIIIHEKSENKFNGEKNYLINHLFLLKKNDNLCFQWNYNNEIYYKMYFINKKSYFDLYIENKSDKNYNTNNNFYEDKKIEIVFEDVVNYCKNILNLNINQIINNGMFIDWSDILKKDQKNKNKKGGLSKKLFSNKMNQNQILEYEFEDEENYYDDEDEEEENDEFQDENN